MKRENSRIFYWNRMEGVRFANKRAKAAINRGELQKGKRPGGGGV